MEAGPAPPELAQTETYRYMARLCYEQYVYLVTCATQNPEDYEPYPPDEEGYVAVELNRDEKLKRLESVLSYELRAALKNMIVHASKSLGQAKLPPPSEPGFNELVMELERVIQTAELDDIVDLNQPWWGENGPPNPLKEPLSIVRIANTRRWRRLPLDELVDGHQLSSDLTVE